MVPRPRLEATKPESVAEPICAWWRAFPEAAKDGDDQRAIGSGKGRMITQLQLKNFTAFTELAIDFSPGINIIIGENGTGKTQLLKAVIGHESDRRPAGEQADEQRLRPLAHTSDKLGSNYASDPGFEGHAP